MCFWWLSVAHSGFLLSRQRGFARIAKSCGQKHCILYFVQITAIRCCHANCTSAVTHQRPPAQHRVWATLGMHRWATGALLVTGIVSSCPVPGLLIARGRPDAPSRGIALQQSPTACLPRPVWSGVACTWTVLQRCMHCTALHLHHDRPPTAHCPLSTIRVGMAPCCCCLLNLTLHPAGIRIPRTSDSPVAPLRASVAHIRNLVSVLPQS